MEIRQVEDKQEWESFLLNQLNTLFVQSYHYGDFYEKLGEKSWIFGIYEDGVLVGGSLVVSVHAKRGDFLYLPYGPVMDFNIKGRLDGFTKFLIDFAKENNYDFIRISPFVDHTEEIERLFKFCGYRQAPMHVLAETTWLLDLSPDEEKLMAGMNKNHRNLIRRCEREGVIVKKFNDEKALQEFNRLHDITAKRHNFHRFSDEYVEKEFKSFVDSEEAFIFQAYLRDKNLDSSAVIIMYGKMAAYRHGASLNLVKQVPTSYYLQWQVILEAKRKGFKYYNFWGIAPENASDTHPFKGITHFKKGFGGFQKDLLPCQDLPITKKYWLNWAVETARSKKRGFK